MPPVDTHRAITIPPASGQHAIAAGPTHPMRRAGMVTAFYALFAALWIYSSDHALMLLFADSERLIDWSVFKGLAFVLVTSALLWLLVWRALAELDVAYRRLDGEQQALAASESRLAGVVGSAMDAIIAVDGAGRIVLFNAAAQRMFVCDQTDAMQRPLVDFVREPVDADNGSSRVAVGRRSDGSTVPVELSTARFDTADGVVTTVVLRDISDRQAQQSEIERLSRLYSALSHVNQVIARTEDRQTLFEQTCRALVNHGGFDCVWIGALDARNNQLAILASAGDSAPLQDEITAATPLRRAGIDQALRAIGDGRHQVGAVAPGASAAFPIHHDRQVLAVLSVHAEDADFFQDRELALLDEVAGDIAFALDNLRREDDRRRAEAVAHREMAFSDAMIESMPGIVYFYDDQRRFLRWNRNFATVSGYRPEEIAQMHPLDFFTADDRGEVEQRIAEVFASGEAFVEADFLTRDGQRIPHYFTGRRVTVDGCECLVGMGVDISRRHQAEQAQARLAAIVDSSRDAIIGKTLDGVVTSWNPGAEALFGYRADEVIGSEIARFIPPAHQDEERRHRDQIAHGAAVDHFESVRINKAGLPVDVAMTLSPIVDSKGRIVGASSIAQDIGARKVAERALRASEARFRSTLDTILEGCQLFGFDWRYLYVNAASAVQNRRPNAELLGRTMPEAWPGIEASDLFALLRSCMDDRRSRHQEIEFVFPDGQSGWFDVRCQPVAEGLFVLSIDISERKRAELELRELNETLEIRVVRRTGELRAALVLAEAADRIKSAFLATMSHELRTPLNSIIGFTGILLQNLAGPLNEEQQRQLGMVRTSARHLLELINDVLDLSKIEAGQLEMRVEDFDVAASVERVVALVQPLAERKQLALDANVGAGIGLLNSDRRRVEQILINLLNNAIKFTATGQVSLTVEHITDFRAAGATDEVEGIRFQVSDTGIGMHPEDLATLFLPFRQLDNGLTRQHEGTGLGLAICRRLVDLLGGEIGVTSEWASGSVFRVVLPLRRSSGA